MSKHPPFKQVEASRPDFEADSTFHYTKITQPDWVPGQGLNNRKDLASWENFAKSKTAKGQKELFTVIDPTKIEPGNVYKLLINGIVPRPIGFCSTIDNDGTANLAPFSYFNAVGHNPASIMISFSNSGSKAKDSCNNIKQQKEFTVNIISEPFVEAANYCSIDAPSDVSEWALTGLTQAPSETVKPARVAESAFSMECELLHFYDLKDDKDNNKVTGTVVLGKIKRFHVRKDMLNEDYTIDADKLMPVSRLGGISYGRLTQAYEVPRPVWEREKERPEVQTALRRGDQTIARD